MFTSFKVDMTFGFRKVKYVFLTYRMRDITITEEFKISSERKYFLNVLFHQERYQAYNFSLTPERQVVKTQRNTDFELLFTVEANVILY